MEYRYEIHTLRPLSRNHTHFRNGRRKPATVKYQTALAWMCRAIDQQLKRPKPIWPFYRCVWEFHIPRGDGDNYIKPAKDAFFRDYLGVNDKLDMDDRILTVKSKKSHEVIILTISPMENPDAKL